MGREGDGAWVDAVRQEDGDNKKGEGEMCPPPEQSRSFPPTQRYCTTRDQTTRAGETWLPAGPRRHPIRRRPPRPRLVCRPVETAFSVVNGRPQSRSDPSVPLAAFHPTPTRLDPAAVRERLLPRPRARPRPQIRRAESSPHTYLQARWTR